ncbi:hypothetical protein AKJ56_01530 [candidate division MSBL1 archaeon SCGC-AAA382N08]|uniref:DUF86 domain-containing protein n=1 Tax=candidate division MSBL1 archaeon SCGC-AAA382N08 TaxID=1698285 RepID=A0A133VPF0_9EURY|nr:hypothetical protein AKJ56_01530 [candidate division MSBL1 archaeon SCGC-AAA382N08]
MEQRISDINEWIKGIAKDRFIENEKTKLAVYKAFQELVEAATDICAMHTADKDRSVGDDYENIERASGDLFSKNLESNLKQANGLRNRLVHEYNGLRDEIAYTGLKDLLPELEEFKEDVSD